MNLRSPGIMLGSNPSLERARGALEANRRALAAALSAAKELRAQKKELEFRLFAEERLAAPPCAPPILVLDHEGEVFERLCEGRTREPPRRYCGQLSVRLNSRSSVSKDCGPDEVGWEVAEYNGDDSGDDSGDVSGRKLTSEGGSLPPFGDCCPSPGVEALREKDVAFSHNEIEYTGDHHGVWAQVWATCPVRVYQLPRPEELYVRIMPAFYEAQLQRREFELVFEHALRDEGSVDVTFLLTGAAPPARYEGVLLAPGDSAPRLACEEEVVDRWPDDGDWFWTWGVLKSEWSNQKGWNC